MTPEPSPFAARVLVQALAAAGVREFVLAPGSRSAPFVYALADAARDDRPDGAPQVEVHVRLDERDAAFLALGIAKAAAVSGDPRPVAVVTTSGTAVANLAPAVLEAHHSGTPLLLLTADRPVSMRGTGANQTTTQPGLFEPAVRLTLDLHVSHDDDAELMADAAAGLRQAVRLALAAATAGDPGPVHLNVAFPEPLVPGDEPWPAHGDDAQPAPAPAPAAESSSDFAFVGGLRTASPARSSSEPATSLEPARLSSEVALPDGPPTLVIAGDGAGHRARELAEGRGWPLLAEPGSGARGGPNAIPAYRLLLGSWPRADEVRRVVVVGRPTLSRPVARLIARDDVEVVRVQRPSAAWPEVGSSAAVLVPEIPDAWFASFPPDGRVVGRAPTEPVTGWLEAWRAAGDAAGAVIREVHASNPQRGRASVRLTGVELADLVARATRPEDVLVIGSSNPVRDLDLVAQWGDVPLVIGNRGLSGIDGMLATASGVAHAMPSRTVRALVGDLTFLHDVGGLLVGPLEQRPHLQIVVANDDGGSVFATLEHGDPSRTAVFERFFATPQSADLSALCAGYGVRHRLARDAAEVAESLASPGPGLSVLEVRVDRARRRELDAQVAARLRDQFHSRR